MNLNESEFCPSKKFVRCLQDQCRCLHVEIRQQFRIYLC